jgi:hypothetical protein
MRHSHAASLLAVAVALGRSASAQIVFESPTTLSLSHLTQGVLTADVNADGQHGMLVPFPDLVYTPFPISGAGATTLSATWPGSVPSGFAFYLQFGFKDVGALNGYAISNAVRVVTP